MGIALALAGASAFAGPLEPSGPPASSSVTLNELDAGLKQIDKATASLITKASNRGVPGGLPIPEDPGTVDPAEGTQAGSVTMQFVLDQGLPPISGGVTTPGAEGSVSVLAFHHTITTPRDAASGLPTGRRQHEPFRITKVYDKATPMLAKACASGQHIKQAILTVRKSGATGGGEGYYTVTLSDCLITGLSTGFPNLEEIEMTYQKIEWTWVDGGITAEDTWSPSDTK